MLNCPPLYAESPPLSRKSHAESPPYCMLNHPPPKPVRFAFKVFLYLFPIARADFLWITCRNFKMRKQQVRGTPLGSPSPIKTSRLCGLGYWEVRHGHRYTNRSAASRLRPLCTVCAFGLPGAKGCR